MDKSLDRITHLFVPYELALELKNRGFNEPCLAFYYLGQFHPQELLKPYFNSEKSEMYFASAPTYSQAIDWFWERHNISVFPFRDNRGMWYNITFDGSTKSITMPKYIERVGHTDTYQSGHFENWLDCQNKSIAEALKII